MRGPGIGLGIDYTETGVSAVLEFPDGRVTALRFDGSPWLSTAIAVTPPGRLVAGPAATRGCLAHPHRYVSAGSLSSRQSAVKIDGRTCGVGDVAETLLRQIWRQAKHLAGPRRIARVAIAVSTPLRSFTDDVVDAAMRAGLPEPSLADTSEALGELTVQTNVEIRDDVRVAVMRIDGGGVEELSVLRYRAGRLAGRPMHVSRSDRKLVDAAAVETLAQRMLRMLESIQRSRPVVVVCQVPQPMRAAVVSQLGDALGPEARVACVDKSAAAHGALVATEHPL